MESFDKYLPEYRTQLQKGTVKAAYKGLMGYIDNLRLHLKTKYLDYFISDVHYGLMDYTYFYFFPKTLKHQNLKVMILFVHDTFKFEILLAGYNKNVQAKYWKLFKENGWNKYHLASAATETDSFVDTTLADNPDFGNLDALTNQIESGAVKFIKDIEDFLAENQKLS